MEVLTHEKPRKLEREEKKHFSLTNETYFRSLVKQFPQIKEAIVSSNFYKIHDILSENGYTASSMTYIMTKFV